jgi:hypothetical protein
MQEALVQERYESLARSVRRALKQMQTDGLVLQLELHRTSSQFAPQRLTEVLHDSIDAGREKFIQKLLHEIDNASFERDKSDVRHQRLRSQVAAKQQQIANERRRLTQTHDALSAQIQDLQQKHAAMLSRREGAAALRNDQMQQSRKLVAKLRSTLTSLSADLSHLRADVSLAALSGARTLRSGIDDMKKGASRLSAHRKDSIARNANQVAALEQNEIGQSQATCGAIRESIRTIVEYVNGLARARAVQARASDIAGVLRLVIAAEVQQHCPKDQKRFARAARDSHDRAIRAKEAELEQTIADARKRRLKLQVDLDAALELIQRLQGEPPDDDVTAGFDASKYDFEASTRQLDETMSQLGLSRRPK